jgi:hypothetical protein
MLSSAAHAQWYYTPAAPAARPAPLYPYELQPGQPYAIEVAPNTYVIQRPAQHAYPYVQPVAPQRQAAVPPVPPVPKFDRPPKPADRGLIEELRQRKLKTTVIHTKQVVREKPIVIETRRVVDDPPRVVERYHVVDDPPLPPPPPRQRQVKRDSGPAPTGDDRRVIHADAVVTILGPDRMTIRLTRKGGDGNPLALGDDKALARSEKD